MPEATKRGGKEAYEGDGVYINRPHQKRGVVQKKNKHILLMAKLMANNQVCKI